MPSDADNFYQSAHVSRQAVDFQNVFKMTVAGNLFVPNDLDRSRQHPALVVGHPMGAVKEQSANLYAQKMAERGFVTLAIDLPCWGDSEGARNRVSPDLYAEGFSAGVDFLANQTFVDGARIGGIGVCGSGGFLISAAKIDARLKAVATVSMYDMGQATRNGIGNSLSLADRQAMIEAAGTQRNAEFGGAETALTGGCPHEIDADSHPIAKEFYDFYRTPRGEFTPAGQSPATTTHPTLTSNVNFLNFYPFNDIETIAPRPMLFIAGDQAHSHEFSDDAYARAAEPKTLHWVEGAGHVDLYDRVNVIPFDKLDTFFGDALA
ncbi:alpha/beta hydrolase [Salinisphaera sp. Q1T1-3]|uniref:alpha/beta hydrolase n=1 Tax=Salinisphaera sp. Q1T1-3 TaxID=2321229 RepID=UPI0018F3ABA9|nr:alpha/beta hydrolase [Salinisphaera sp. Q1T1-3]